MKRCVLCLEELRQGFPGYTAMHVQPQNICHYRDSTLYDIGTDFCIPYYTFRVKEMGLEGLYIEGDGGGPARLKGNLIW